MENSSQSSQYKSGNQLVNTQINRECMTELNLRDDTKVLSIFDTGSTVKLISDAMVTSSSYLSQFISHYLSVFMYVIPVRQLLLTSLLCCVLRFTDDCMLITTAVIVADLGTVMFVLSTPDVNPLNIVMNKTKIK